MCNIMLFGYSNKQDFDCGSKYNSGSCKVFQQQWNVDILTVCALVHTLNM
jgi:hypothetical protein